MEFRCKKCGRLIADVSDEAMLPNALQCQHCHHMNIIRRKAPRPIEPGPEPIEPAPVPEVTPEPEYMSAPGPEEPADFSQEKSEPEPGEPAEEVE